MGSCGLPRLRRLRKPGQRGGCGADAIIAQGMEAGGHRGAFHADQAEHHMVGLIALLPQVVDAVNVSRSLPRAELAMRAEQLRP